MSSVDDIFTSRHHAMDYFIVDGVKLRTGYGHERDWYLLPIHELLDNALDFVTKHWIASDVENPGLVHKHQKPEVLAA
jgi:hypothetical protein